jgi:hypothetical protein
MEYTDEVEPGRPMTDYGRAMELVREWREQADALEAFPGLIRWAGHPEEFESELYEAARVLDGTVAGGLDYELYAELGGDQEDGDDLLAIARARPAPPRGGRALCCA